MSLTLGADFRAALVANCFRGALPPVDLRAVCFVRAIYSDEKSMTTQVITTSNHLPLIMTFKRGKQIKSKRNKRI